MRAGSLFSGYGGLDLAIEAVFCARTLWHSEIDPAASRVLAARWPDVPNLGDITKIVWSAVPRVDVLGGGFPCQDVSHAGKRAGLRPDTRSGLWSQMAYAIDQLRPTYVVAENVRGLLSAQADSDMEPCPLCVGDEPAGALRALGAVLGDLADLGYDAWWCGLRAADVGAPHGRFRVFILAADTRSDGRDQGAQALCGWESEPAARGDADEDADRAARGERWQPAPGQAEGGRARADTGGRDRASAADATGDGRHEGRTEPAGQLGRPDAAQRRATAANPERSGRDGRTPDQGREPVQRAAAARGGADAPTDPLRDEQPWEYGEQPWRATPTRRGAADPDTAFERRRTARRYDGVRTPGLVPGDIEWGPYEPAVRRWEHVTGRVAPAPTETSPKGAQRLSPRFVEWMLGLPAGWVTDIPDTTRNDQLKMLGNGVVPQQAEAALRYLLAVSTADRRWVA